jgi:Sec-independent protein translocase protein TatA
MKNLAKSLGRYLINFNEMIKKEKEKESKEIKDTKKKPKDGKIIEEKEGDGSNKVKDFENY